MQTGDFMSIKNYTVFDVETANRQRESVCSIGIVRVENSKIVFKKEYLIDPECPFCADNIAIHGIWPSMVQNAPSFGQLWGEIQPYFADCILVAHGAKGMDLGALVKSQMRYHIPTQPLQYVCTLELAKKLLTRAEYPSFRLNNLCAQLGVPLEHHHNALDDALACQGLLDYFNREYPQFVVPTIYEFKEKKKKKTLQTSLF